MLAAYDFSTYTTATHALKLGDRILLDTGGILKAADSHFEEFGENRLHAVLHDSAGQTHSEAADSVIASVLAWSAIHGDDLTVLCDYAA